LKSWTLTGDIKMPPAVYREMGFPSRPQGTLYQMCNPKQPGIVWEEGVNVDEWESFRSIYSTEMAEVLLERKIVSRWSNLIKANTKKYLKLDFREFRIIGI
jgi:hypothetical protein